MDSSRRFPSHPQSASGDFYVVHNECISCGAPHAVAPDLIGWAVGGADHEHCIWKKQPETPRELEQAFAAFDASEIGCYRYAGNDPRIMRRLGPDYCDQPFPKTNTILAAADDETPFDVTLSGGNESKRHNRFELFLQRLRRLFQ